jgi:hypothetical protein
MDYDCAMWCTTCGCRLQQEEIIGWGCPKCHDQGIPCGPDKDVKVEVNWHELHVLCCWSEFWASRPRYGEFHEDRGSMLKTVYAIARRLERQWPEFNSLTLGSELAELPERLAESGIQIESIESNLPKAPPTLELGPGAVGFSRSHDD